MKAKLFLLEVVRFREIHVLENLCGYKANPIEQTDAFSVRRRAICGCFQSLCNTILLPLAVALYQHMNFSRHDELCLTVWTSHQIGGQFGQWPSTKIYRKKSPDLLDYSDNLPIQVSFENFKLNKSIEKAQESKHVLLITFTHWNKVNSFAFFLGIDRKFIENVYIYKLWL